MATRAISPTREPRPGKQNVGNRRSGAVRGTRSGIRRGTLPWRKDPAIRERVDLVWRLWAQGYTCEQMLGPVNELMKRRGIPEVEIHTVWEDRGRIKEILAEEQEDAKQAHQESFQLVKREAWRAFHATAQSSLNRSAYLNTVRSTEESLAKLDGSMIQRSEVVVHDGDRELLAQVALLIARDRPDLDRRAVGLPSLDSGEAPLALLGPEPAAG